MTILCISKCKPVSKNVFLRIIFCFNLYLGWNRDEMLAMEINRSDGGKIIGNGFSLHLNLYVHCHQCVKTYILGVLHICCSFICINHSSSPIKILRP